MEIVQNNLSTSLFTNRIVYQLSTEETWNFMDKLVKTSGVRSGIPFSKLWRYYYVPLSSLFRGRIHSFPLLQFASFKRLNHLNTQPWSNLFSWTACLLCWKLSESSWLFWLDLVLWFHYRKNLNRWIPFHWYPLLLLKDLEELDELLQKARQLLCCCVTYLCVLLRFLVLAEELKCGLLLLLNHVFWRTLAPRIFWNRQAL
jgi:hypothetical protein